MEHLLLLTIGLSLIAFISIILADNQNPDGAEFYSELDADTTINDKENSQSGLV